MREAISSYVGTIINNGKYCNAIPITGREGLWGCEMLRLPRCLDNRLTDAGKVVSLRHRPRSTSQKHYFSASDTNLC
jgi:hypothetical protein